MPAVIDDTYAEAFRSIYVEFLITARRRRWVEHAVNAATGNASSTIMCDCEAGLDRFVGPGGEESCPTPDGRPGAIVQLHVPRFRKDRVPALERAALVRISQNILTCPTAACFNLIDSTDYFRMGRKIAFFGDGFQKRIERFGRKMWWVPTLGGEFILDRRLGYADGLMGGNLWFFGETEDAALAAAEAGRGGRPRLPRRHHAVPRWHRRQWVEGRQQIFLHRGQHIREVLPASRWRPHSQFAVAGERPFCDGNHHQRPRFKCHHPRHASRDRCVGRYTWIAPHLGGQLRRASRQELHLPSSREAAGCWSTVNAISCSWDGAAPSEPPRTRASEGLRREARPPGIVQGQSGTGR